MSHEDTIGSLAASRELNAAVARLLKVAYLDPLTQLLNRSAFDAVSQDFDYARPVAVVFIDLTGFKALNDKLGHDAGDIGLINAGARIAEVAAAVSGLAFRMGGDEFVVLMNPARADELIARLMVDRGRIPFEYEGQDTEVALCAGAAFPIRDEAGTKLRDFVKRAETACRVAKDREPGGCVVWDLEIQHEAPISPRERCRFCGATTTLLVVPSRRSSTALASCANCGEAFTRA